MSSLFLKNPKYNMTLTLSHSDPTDKATIYNVLIFQSNMFILKHAHTDSFNTVSDKYQHIE